MAPSRAASWQSSAPSVQQGKWLWVKTVTTYTDTTSTTTYTKSYAGEDGAAGAPGTGVTVSSVEYGVSSSGSVQPDGWSSNIPTVQKGQWLWIRTTYSDSSSTMSKSYVGTDGEDGTSVYVVSSTKSGGTTTVVLSDGTTLSIDDGDDGDDGAPGANGYVHIAWANSADGSQDFSTSVSTDKSYLGTYTDNTAADSQHYYDYSWSLIKGPQGRSVSSIVTQYYLSTSDQSPTGGEWSDTPPDYVSGRHYWRRDAITWDDDGSETTTYTVPVLDGGLNSANETASAASAREQLVYRSAPAGTISMPPVTTWVTDAYGQQGTWTTVRPEYSTESPVMFVATQRQTVEQASGTACSCTTPRIDMTTTVIDGANIIANSVTAAQIDATDLHVGAANVDGRLTADQIDASGLTIGTSQVDGLSEEISDAVGVTYDHTFTKSNGVYTFTASLTKCGTDVTASYDPDFFVWYLRTETGDSLWARGVTMTIDESYAGYRASIVGGIEEVLEFDLVTSAGDGVVDSAGNQIATYIVRSD